MASIRTRVRDAVIAEMKTIVGLLSTNVRADLWGFEQLNSYPVLFVMIGSGGEVRYEVDRWIREIMMLDLIGYVKVGVGREVATPREDFYQSVFNKLTGQGMLDRLATDYSANNSQGAIFIRHTGAPETDEGQAPPFGYFILPVAVILHYRMGGL